MAEVAQHPESAQIRFASAMSSVDLRHLRAARIDTAFGAVLTQVFMAAVLVAAGAVLHGSVNGRGLDDVPGIANALVPSLGLRLGRAAFAAGLAGAAVVAAVVVCLTAAWGVGEVARYKRSLEHSPRDAPWFYGIFSAMLILGGIVVCSGADLVRLSVAVQVMNALLLPVVLGFLYLLGRRALSAPHRLSGIEAALTGLLIAATCALGVGAAVLGLAN